MSASRFEAAAWLEPVEGMRYRTRTVAAALALCADEDGLAHPGRAKLAKATGLQARLVGKGIADLIDAGLLDVASDATSTTATVYSLTTRDLSGSAINGGRSDKDARS